MTKKIEGLALWRALEETDPRYTREVSYGSHEFTSVNAYAMIKRATALWGPYGIAWGLRNCEWGTIEHRALARGRKPARDAVTITLQAQLHYPSGHKSSPLAHDPPDAGVIEVAVDDELEAGGDTHKKLTTAAISKALSYLGFGGDVFLGHHDDGRYLDELDAKVADGEFDRFFDPEIEPDPDPEEAEQEQRERDAAVEGSTTAKSVDDDPRDAARDPQNRERIRRSLFNHMRDRYDTLGLLAESDGVIADDLRVIVHSLGVDTDDDDDLWRHRVSIVDAIEAWDPDAEEGAGEGPADTVARELDGEVIEHRVIGEGLPEDLTQAAHAPGNEDWPSDAKRTVGDSDPTRERLDMFARNQCGCDTDAAVDQLFAAVLAAWGDGSCTDVLDIPIDEVVLRDFRKLCKLAVGRD